MKKKIIISVLIIAFLILFVIPVRVCTVKDGGSMTFSPLIWWYTIWNLNQITTEEAPLPHDDPDFKPVETYQIKGTRIEVLGHVVYEDIYEVH